MRSYIFYLAILQSITLSAYAQLIPFTFLSKSFTPNAISFTGQTGVTASSTVTSNTVTLAGTGSRQVTATCTNCTLQRNGAGGFSTAISGFRSGDTLTLRVTASASAMGVVTSSVKVGDVTSATWSVTTAGGCSHGTQTFAYTGSDQTFTVPSGCTSITVKAWGAGGGGYCSDTGGAGGFATGTISVSSGQALKVVVGSGGTGACNGHCSGAQGSTVYGGGNYGTEGNVGGGYSGVFATSVSFANALIVAGGGGGGGGGCNSSPGAPGGGSAGGSPVNSYFGGAGTQSSGGPAGSTTGATPTAGTALLGGYSNCCGGAGGGGGGGYYGGGAGGREGSWTHRAGGGGSGYVGGAGVSSASTSAGSGTTPPSTGDGSYSSGIGVGGTSGNGGAGQVVVTY